MPGWPELHQNSATAIRSGRGYSQEYRCVCQDGSIYWLKEDVQVEPRAPGHWRAVGVCTEITERKRLESILEYSLKEAQERADCDPLTRLLNHRAFQKRLEKESARARREQTTLAVVMLDVDYFKFFNDVYGHAVGDHVLCQIALRLRENCRLHDTLSRFGGDEFALILPGVKDTPWRRSRHDSGTRSRSRSSPRATRAPFPSRSLWARRSIPTTIETSRRSSTSLICAC